MCDETWQYASSANLCAMYIDSLSLESELKASLKDMFDHFGNHFFLKYQAQGFQRFCLKLAYDVEETHFKKRVQTNSLSDVVPHANIISSDVIYKIKMNDDLSIKLKARITPRGKEDSTKEMLRSDCSICLSPGFLLVPSAASLENWRLIKIDIKTAFLQTGNAERDVHVSPIESQDSGKCMWLY